MAWQDRGYGGPSEEGGFRGFTRRVFGDENPLRWALSLYQWRGILVKVHVFFALWIVLQLLFSLGGGGLGLGAMAFTLLSLFALVLLHEYGHCFACRRVGGEADEILMWPLGGLAFCRPPHHWRADLVTTLGGPAVNAILLLPLGLLVWIVSGDWRGAVFNPFRPSEGLVAAVAGSSGTAYWAAAFAWSAHFTNAVLLALNVLLPMYPLDGGRILHALLWRSLGHGRGTFLAARIGIGVAIAVAVVGLAIPNGDGTMLFAIALFAGISSWLELQRLKMTATDSPFLEPPAHATRGEDDTPTRSAERQRKRAEREAHEAARLEAEIDRILAKISASGIQSLTRKERKTLERAGKETDSRA